MRTPLSRIVGTLLLAGFLLFPLATSAQPIAPCTSSPCYTGSFQDGIDAAQNNLPFDGSLSITDVMLRIISIVLDVILLIAVFAIIIAGVYLIVSGGDEGQKEKAKKIIIYVVAGIIVILFSRAIVVFVNSIFG